MKCPRCETTTLDERDRDGITVDACPGCRGLWLDRGELEKLIARATREIEELSGPRAAAAEPPPPRDRDDDRRDRDPDRRDRDYERRDRDYDRRDPRYRKKRSVLDILGDVFD
jgi:Zn-finger nucleic acid-binding protein